MGEVKLGELPGVMDTTSGWMGGKEVVAVDFDPKAIRFEQLLSAAQKMECATAVFATSDTQLASAKKLVGARALKAKGTVRLAKDSDRRFNLRRHGVLSRIPMTTAQAMKANVAVAQRQLKGLPLSPRQQRWVTALGRLSETQISQFPITADGTNDAKKLQALTTSFEAKLKSLK